MNETFKRKIKNFILLPIHAPIIWFFVAVQYFKNKIGLGEAFTRWQVKALEFVSGHSLETIRGTFACVYWVTRSGFKAHRAAFFDSYKPEQFI